MAFCGGVGVYKENGYQYTYATNTSFSGYGAILVLVMNNTVNGSLYNIGSYSNDTIAAIYAPSAGFYYQQLQCHCETKYFYVIC